MIVNKNRTNSSNLRQWHPAFFADIQIELESERENLIFENEHQLGTKPMEIDALVIKRRPISPLIKTSEGFSGNIISLSIRVRRII